MIPPIIPLWKDRSDAGSALGKKFSAFKNNKKVLIVGILRGGLIIAKAMAQGIAVDFDFLVSQKISHPLDPDLAIGAVTSTGEPFFERNVQSLHQMDIDRALEKSRLEAQRRESLFRINFPEKNYTNKIVVLVDDGIATGATIEAAVIKIKQKRVKKIIIGTPVISKSAYQKIQKRGIAVRALNTSNDDFFAVSSYYESFHQLSDKEVFHNLE